MRQKCRKSVKCFANGCQRLLCCLLTRLRMNSRTNAPACALVWERTHTPLYSYSPLHIYVHWSRGSSAPGCKNRIKIALLLENVMQNVRKSAWQICIIISSNCIPNVSSISLQLLPPSPSVFPLKYFETLQCVAGEQSWMCPCLLWLKCFYAVRLMCFRP